MKPGAYAERFEKLCAFLESVMVDLKVSRRVRISAASRLADLLERQQRAEDREARRQIREVARLAKEQQKGLQNASPVPDTLEEDTQMTLARECLAGIKRKANEMQKSA